MKNIILVQGNSLAQYYKYILAQKKRYDDGKSDLMEKWETIKTQGTTHTQIQGNTNPILIHYPGTIKTQAISEEVIL